MKVPKGVLKAAVDSVLEKSGVAGWAEDDQRAAVERQCSLILEPALKQLREELEGEADKYEAAARDEDPAPYKLELGKAEGIVAALNSVLGDKEAK